MFHVSESVVKSGLFEIFSLIQKVLRGVVRYIKLLFSCGYGTSIPGSSAVFGC